MKCAHIFDRDVLEKYRFLAFMLQLNQANVFFMKSRKNNFFKKKKTSFYRILKELRIISVYLLLATLFSVTDINLKCNMIAKKCKYFKYVSQHNLWQR